MTAVDVDLWQFLDEPDDYDEQAEAEHQARIREDRQARGMYDPPHPSAREAANLCPSCRRTTCKCPSLEKVPYGKLAVDNPFREGTPEHDEWARQEHESPTVPEGVGIPADSQMPEDERSILDRLRAELVDSAGLDDIPDPNPLIGKEILFRDCLAWMVGKPGCMKSFTALDMAGSVGTGEHWQGWQVEQGTVLYLVAEGVRGIKKRVRAWEKAMGRTMDNVHFLPVAVQSKHGAQWNAFVDLVAEIRPALVVIDTQARVTVGVEENSNTEMGEFVHQAERLRKASGACVLIVHHIGRNGDTGRGATTLDGAVNTIIKVTKDEDKLKLQCTKNKDGEEWDDIHLRAVPMGDSLVLTSDNAAFGPPAEESLTSKKWVQDWWRVHELEPVSIAVLVKSDVVSETTFHRCKLDLIRQGVAAKEGTGNATRYRLLVDPTSR